MKSTRNIPTYTPDVIADVIVDDVPEIYSNLVQPRDNFPKTGLLFYAKAPGLVDTIGLSVEVMYPQLSPAVQSIVSADGGMTKRTDAEIIALLAASPLLNVPGGDIYGDAVDDIWVIYADGQAPSEAAERRLWKYLFDTRFEPLYDNGEPMLDNGFQIYEVV